jgi:quercetin dioxygenase-like cupin family protein
VKKNERIYGDDLHELAAMYALGSLDARERELFEQHLYECDDCAGDVLSLSQVAGLIGESVSAVPPEQLRKRLLSRIGGSPRVPGIVMEQGGLLIARSAELAWQPLATGIYLKPLFEDRDSKYNTSLVRMDPGAHYPSHHHAAIEEMFLLSGDLHLEGQVMRAGDYCRADRGSIHGETFTDDGCLFLLMASPENQIAENRVI